VKVAQSQKLTARLAEE